MKHIVLLLIFPFFALIAKAQTNDAASEKILEKVKATYSKNAFSINFKHELKNTKAKVNETETGSAYVNKEKYNLTLDKSKINQIYDGKKVYNIDKENKEITVETPQDKSDLLTPTKILDSYKKDYTISNGGTKTIDGKSYTNIKLTPKDKKAKIKSVEVAVDKATNQLKQMVETNSDGVVTTLTITKFTANILAPNSFFKVNLKDYKSKGYTVTEL